MRFVRGGELFSHLRKKNRFEEDLARFYSCQVCHAIGYLHEQKIIYRDLKPENILMDEAGYLALTDFGLAKILEDGQQANTFCGTPDYLAPEILNDAGHSFPVDWWAIGILTYEMIVGCPPFFTQSNNYEKMYQMIKKREVTFPDPERYKINMSPECKDFIQQLLSKDPTKRLGRNGVAEVLGHPWFKGINHEMLVKREIPTSYKPKVSADALDVSNFDKEFTDEESTITMLNAGELAQVKKHQSDFDEF
jgi:serum/glucocorticoid-regulated kinase 2